jgi:hypothetical protein
MTAYGSRTTAKNAENKLNNGVSYGVNHSVKSAVSNLPTSVPLISLKFGDHVVSKNIIISCKAIKAKRLLTQPFEKNLSFFLYSFYIFT